MNNARSKSSGQFQPNRSDAEHRRLTPQQQAERRAELARLTTAARETAEKASERIDRQMAAAAPVAVETSDLMSRHEARLAKMRQLAGVK